MLQRGSLGGGALTEPPLIFRPAPTGSVELLAPGTTLLPEPNSLLLLLFCLSLVEVVVAEFD